MSTNDLATTEDIVIVDATRTPMGAYCGAFSSLSAPELGTAAIKGLMDKSGIDPQEIDDVYMGNVLSGGLKQAPARQAALNAGIPDGSGAVTVNKVCGSGMQAVIFAHNQIKLGDAEVVIAGGMESMTNAPHLIRGRQGLGMGHGKIEDSMFTDGLEDAYTGGSMGAFGQKVADDKGITREQMDAYAIESLNRANKAIAEQALTDEITPVTVKTRRSETVVVDDEQPGNANIEKIPSLRPAFAKEGTLTAANSSSISDGASALLLMSQAGAASRGIKPMARIVAHTRHSHEPGLFTTAPVSAIKKLFEKTGWDQDSTDLFEINEAFAMVTMMAINELNLDHAKVNVHGGACAQGHPLGSTGSRIIVTLLHALKRQGKQRGIASLCIGGGEALAIAVEML